mmetsp:Transcript_33882/g.97631  ORF Transcript_33882/g.97631 Transcript_33882/m.97631 type:complete len:170 (-) Transcript_33882:1458-1967(-)
MNSRHAWIARHKKRNVRAAHIHPSHTTQRSMHPHTRTLPRTVITSVGCKMTALPASMAIHSFVRQACALSTNHRSASQPASHPAIISASQQTQIDPVVCLSVQRHIWQGCSASHVHMRHPEVDAGGVEQVAHPHGRRRRLHAQADLIKGMRQRHLPTGAHITNTHTPTR